MKAYVVYRAFMSAFDCALVNFHCIVFSEDEAIRISDEMCEITRKAYTWDEVEVLT